MPNPEIFDIDETRLDREWMDQPRFYYKYACELADARKDMEQAKANIDVVKAQLDSVIRSNPAAFGMEKVTEAAIANMIMGNADYQTAVNDLHEKRHLVDLFQAAVSALDHRKRALECLVDLHGQNYFSAPRESKSSGNVMREVEKRRARRALKSDE